MMAGALRVIALALVFLSAFACPGSIIISSAFATSTCNFQYDIVNGTCTFKACSYQASSSSNKKQISWIQCFNECCDSSTAGQQDTFSVLQQCQSYNNKRKSLIIGLAIGFTFSFITLVITIILCCKIQSCPIYKLKEKFKKSKKDETKEVVFAPSKDFVDAGLNITNLKLENGNDSVTEYAAKSESELNGKLMHFDLTKNMRLMRCKCCVCQQVKPHCYLTCKHYFHIDCIGGWLRRHNLCPSCGTKDLKYIHIYCMDCREDLKVLPVNKFKSKYMKNEVFRCGKCKQENQ